MILTSVTIVAVIWGTCGISTLLILWISQHVAFKKDGT